MAPEKIENKPKNIAVVVAHPDDETLWCGGLILKNPQHHWFIACLSRRYDIDRAPKFQQVLIKLKAQGIMGNLNDDPDQIPLPEKIVENEILNILPNVHFDIILTHNPLGEYTRHRRHEEVGIAVQKLWENHKISTKELWIFAYEDNNKKYFPKPIKSATHHETLSIKVWNAKYDIITQVYGFAKTSFEAKTTPKEEAFWKFTKPIEGYNWIKKQKLKQ
ncbi:PIG-L family deacetylase [Zunongwangia sp. HGR-M22]|uniref:PIG-L family deacetylase n=1 Tax=Zunongwangia sp. HGR-M22 TaxID=3015168 RepID=UPI0022DD7F27|nr:PIG-L family deacetylase [Zunongwangia sp. HGR-M22]WBL24209.1 PIG-L family deacetylase [Zunongwangia sp. HGR-M22]